MTVDADVLRSVAAEIQSVAAPVFGRVAAATLWVEAPSSSLFVQAPPSIDAPAMAQCTSKKGLMKDFRI